MSLDALKAALPEYARDLRRNLDAVTEQDGLSEQRLWGTLLACAIAARSARVLREVAPEAGARLSADAFTAAKSAAALMAVSNVFHRTRHLLSDPAYGELRTGLRMTARAHPDVPKADVEFWSFAVSAVNACGLCLDAHERVLSGLGVERATVQEAIKIAAVIEAVGTTLDAEAVMNGSGGA
ncbi:carboxymuconolactone decarboxylase family protein [Streptomyces sp. NBC_01498]|uniref:carboxymuconolactone decarboxylase family protein n=1 Tax=Streptomyces sp. NBC_01498 TaxID=2975870 RepID=UPI002E7C2DAB|nr:carboxymuconolactone decarboxylase family protein [Streptomyces sp. NBC_01498]WTL24880.1 carboxymuconolactone decarboxylase family protein [Streptomyces sp. NBC_01498]